MPQFAGRVPEICGEECLICARLVDVFRSDPNGIAVGDRPTEITPARTRAERALRVIPGEAVIRAGALRSNVKVAYADLASIPA